MTVYCLNTNYIFISCGKQTTMLQTISSFSINGLYKLKTPVNLSDKP